MSDYTLQNLILVLNTSELAILATYPLLDKKQWADPHYDSIKKRIKDELLYGQLDRCAYCRKLIEGAGKYEPMEHIVAKSLHPEWMLEPHNLIVTCDSCNNLKNNDPTLDASYNSSAFPQTSASFLIFNPHFDRWSDHLQYEDELFLIAVPGSKGQATIDTCQLYRFNIIINRAKELKLEQKTPARRMVFRLQSMNSGSSDYQRYRDELLKAIDFFLKRMEDDPKFAG